MTYMSEQEVQKQHLDVLGPELGPVYNALYNDCAWLHVKWDHYVEIYGTKSERIDLLNRAAGVFFRITQDALWNDTLINLCRLTDPASTWVAGQPKQNLSLWQLPSMISDDTFGAEIKRLVELARAATTFARDWRNRRIAHRDLALAITEGAQAIATASRNDVDNALHAVSRVLERIHEFYFNSPEFRLERITETVASDAVLYVIRDGLEAEERRRKRIREREIEPEEIQPPRPI